MPAANWRGWRAACKPRCNSRPTRPTNGRRSLVSLIENAVRGVWTPEARLLYDLQKVCVDHERGIYTLDVWGWASSLGRKSLKRFLPGQRDVLMSKHLRGATRRVPLGAAVAACAQPAGRPCCNRRSTAPKEPCGPRFKPAIETALDKVKLLPQNLPERVARRKLIEEILDRIVERGFLDDERPARRAVAQQPETCPTWPAFGSFFPAISCCKPTSNWPKASTACTTAAKSICACRSGSARWPLARRWAGC